MKRNISIALVLLVLFASISPIWADNPRQGLPQSNQEVRFRGTVVGFPEPWGLGVDGVNVEIGEILVDPTGNLEVGDTTTVTWPIVPPFPYNLQLEIGDRVEAYGRYGNCEDLSGWSGLGEHCIFLEDPEHHYLEIVEEPIRVKFRGTAECDEYEIYDEYGNYVIGAWVDEILEDPQGKLEVGDFIHVKYQESHGFNGGDCVEVYGTYVEEEWETAIVVGGPYGSPGDYIEECDQAPRVKCRGTATSDEWYAPQPNGNYFVDIDVHEILEDPQGKLEIGGVYWVEYQDQHDFSTGDCIEVYGTFREGGIVVGGAYGSPEDYITECQPTLTPVIIVPGYYASLCFFDHCGWFPVLAEPVYRDLIQALEGAGYRSGENLIIGYYPWWRPNTESAQDYLADKWVAQALQASPNGKVHIITHSNGGLVARQYIQAAGPSHVDKLIMIAPPNQGVPKPYYYWGGAAFPPGDFDGWSGLQRAAVKLIAHKFCPDVLPGDLDFWFCLHMFVPSLQELMPIADQNYLYNVDTGQWKKPSDLTEGNRNPNLGQLNAAISDLFNDVEGVIVYGSNDHRTLSMLRVKNRSILDGPMWADGKPIPGEQGEGREAGDGTIPEVHQCLPDCTPDEPKCRQDFEKLSADHGAIVSQVRNCVLYELGLASECKPAPVTVESLSDEDVVFFSMVTEARWLISDSQGRRVGYSSDGQFVSEIPGVELFEEAEYHVIGIPQPVTGNYNVQVTGLTGTQSYNIGAFTYLSGDTLLQAEGTVGSGSTHTVPAPYSPPSTLTGNVALQGRPSPSGASWVTDVDVGLYLPPDDSLLYSYSATTNEYGRFTIPDVPRGTYTIWVKGSHTLSNVKSNVSIGDGTNEVNFGTLLEGDANNDNCVNAPDFSILRTAFGKCQGQSGYDTRSDFNEDGCVNAPDFSLLRTNFGLCGDIAVGAAMGAREE